MSTCNRLTPKLLGDGLPPADPAVLFAEARVADGFVAPALRLAVIPYRRLVHRRRAAAPAPTGGRLASLGDLAAGEHVVHEDHGVARFAGFDTRTVAAITRGSEGAQLASGPDRVTVPPDVTAVADTVGAGDSFMAALIFALVSQGWHGEPVSPRRLEEIGATAARAAAITVSRPGADLPDLTELELKRGARVGGR